MQATHPHSRPCALSELPAAATAASRELEALADLARAGLPLADVVVVPAAVEERFYRLNNLPQRLNRVFAAVDPEDPDEDDVEEAAPEAVALVGQHYMLDEFIDDFYAATRALPAMVRVRRPEEDGEVVARGRPALLALKHAFQRDWSYDAVWQRMATRQAIALEARPILLHDAEDGHAADALSARAEEALGRPVTLRVAAAGHITGVRPRAG